MKISKSLPAYCLGVLLCMPLSVRAQEMQDAHRITNNPAREGFPSWSPDGKYIICQYTEAGDTSGQNGLWKISLDGSGAQQIFSGIAEHPKCSPDGRYIVFDADTGQNIKMLPFEGGEPVLFLPDSIKIDKGGLPCWSPDASEIAFKDESNYLCIHNISTGKTARVFNSEEKVLMPGCWTSDGKYVLLTIMDKQSRKSTIWKVSKNGEDRKQITGHHENLYRYLALSPDGSLLIYAALEDRYLGLFIMPSGGGASMPFIVSPDGHIEAPAWSPGGRKVAFSSSINWNADIYVMDADIKQITEKLEN